MKVGSLFAGIGGFDLAAERTGMEVAWQSEIDKHASQVLAHHFTAPNYGDIHEIGPLHDTVDVLTGGFPCQDYSVAGKRDGLAGDRGALWWEYHRLITELKPTWVVGENVPGLLSSRGGQDFETIIGSLTECGYGVAWAVLDAQYFGVAQRRRRVFIVGHSGGEPRPEVLTLSEGVFGHPAPSREQRQRTAQSPTNSTRNENMNDKVISFNWQSGGDVRLGVKEEQTDALHSSQTPAIIFEDNRRDGIRIQKDDITPTLQGFSGTGGNNQPMVASYVLQGSMIGRNPEAGPNGKGYADAHTSPSYTLDLASGTPGVASQTSVRRLTPLECERLQGFPDSWTDIPGNSDTQRYRQLGNAVAVPVVEWILRNVAEAS